MLRFKQMRVEAMHGDLLMWYVQHFVTSYFLYNPTCITVYSSYVLFCNSTVNSQ